MLSNKSEKNKHTHVLSRFCFGSIIKLNNNFVETGSSAVIISPLAGKRVQINGPIDRTLFSSNCGKFFFRFKLNLNKKKKKVKYKHVKLACNRYIPINTYLVFVVLLSILHSFFTPVKSYVKSVHIFFFHLEHCSVKRSSGKRSAALSCHFKHSAIPCTIEYWLRMMNTQSIFSYT